MPCVLAMGETDVYQIEDGKDDVIMTETLALDTDGPYIILKDYDVSYKIGLRFTNINISRGETITEAILSVYCKYDFPNGTGTVTIYGLKVADAPVLDDPEDLSGPLTNSYVIWNISDVKGPNKWHNVTITPIIQEIVNQYGWKSGNSLALIILSEKGNIRRQFTSADYMNPAKLYITITPPTPPGGEYELIKTYKGYEIYNVTEYGGASYESFSDWVYHTDNSLKGKISKYGDYTLFYELQLEAITWHYKNYGDGYFNEYEIVFYHNVTSYDVGGEIGLITLSNYTDKTVGDLDGLTDGYYIQILLYGENSTHLKGWMRVRNPSEYWVDPNKFYLEPNKNYKMILKKEGLNLNLKIYDENDNMIFSSSKTLAQESIFNVIYLPHSYDQSGNEWLKGYIYKLSFGEPMIIGWHIEIWDNNTQINGNFTSLEDAIEYIDNELISPIEQPYNPEWGGYEVIPRRYVKLGFLMSGLGLMMVGLIAISYKPTLGRAIMGILMIVLAMGLLIHLTQI